MSYENKIYEGKFSTAKAILAALWQVREIGREDLSSHWYIKFFCNDKHGNTHRSSISRLCKAKLLKKDYNNILVLTEEGKKQALLAYIEAESAIHRMEVTKWDGGWRIVLFDIPESKRKHRDYLRKVLKLVGFKEFQRSIWIYPYPVPNFLKDLIFSDTIKPHIRFITTDLVDDDTDLRALFELPAKHQLKPIRK